MEFILQSYFYKTFQKPNKTIRNRSKETQVKNLTIIELAENQSIYISDHSSISDKSQKRT